MVNSLSNISPVLDKILYPTYGQIIYQEQVTEICRKIAGYDEGKADLIRKLIGRKLKDEMDAIVPELTKAFMDYGKLNQEQADYLASAVQACSGYTFNHCLAGGEHIMTIYNRPTCSIETMYKAFISRRFAKTLSPEEIDTYYLSRLGTDYSVNLDTMEVVTNNIRCISFSGIREIFKITTEKGRTVRCTDNHKFPTDKGEKETRDLRLGDNLYVFTDKLRTEKIISIEYDGVENTYSVEMQDPYHTFILGSGIVSHNSHAVEYGLIAYQTAYLKANYPVEYMVALLNNNMDNQDKVVEYINECAKLGIEVLPPDVSVGNMTFVPTDDNKAIRIGISYIKGLHNISCEYKPGMSMKAFVMTNNIKPTDAEKLVKAGTFDVFKMSRGQMLIVAGEYISKIRQIEDRLADYANRIKIKQDTLKTTNPTTKKYKQLIKQIDNANERIIKLNNEHDDTEKVLDDVANYDIAIGELETLGFTYQDRFAKYVKDGYDVYNSRKIGTQYVLGEVIKVKKIKDKNKHDMAFVKVSTIDKKMIELVMFASSYQQLDEKAIYVFKINKGKFLERAMKPKEKV